MQITEETVSRMAALARLDFTPEQTRRLTGELDAIVTYMDVLRTLPDDAAVHTLPGVPLAALREDVCRPSLPREALLACAGEQDGDFFLVPRTVE